MNRSANRRPPLGAGLAACLALAAARLFATDVGFWSEYAPDRDDAAKTYLLLDFHALPWKAAAGPVSAVEPLGRPARVEDGRFGAALQLDGQSGLRCVMTNVFAGGQVSLEAWVRLDRYPAREACIIFRRAVVDDDARFDPAKDRSKGFALLVDAQGALQLETVNTFYGSRTRTRTAPGAVPLNRWVHVAGTSAGARRLCVDGRELANESIHWGQGLTVSGEEEAEAQPVYVGNNDRGDAGFAGLLDQVRVHRNVFKFWPPEDESWTDPAAKRPVAAGPPHFVPEHAPVAVVPLDGDSQATGRAGAAVELSGGAFCPGVRGQAYAGKISVTAPNLFRSAEGSLEFWLKPRGVNCLSDRNRTFVDEPFNFYLYNGGEGQPTLYFGDADLGLHFVHAPFELHPGHWYHVLFTWRGAEICAYVDGSLSGHTTTRPLAPNGRAAADRFRFLGYETIGAVDEIRIYDRALLPAEAANAYWRYRDPARLAGPVALPSVECVGEYLPSAPAIGYRLLPYGATNDYARVRLVLRNGDGREVRTWKVPWTLAADGRVELPRLKDGDYALAPEVATAAGATLPGAAFRFHVQHFAWERNTLGDTDEVFPPFTPMEVTGARVAVVSRTMTMNGFGLWDEVVAAGRELLDAPMALRFETAAGTGAWTRARGKFVEKRPTRAVYEARAESAAVAVSARSTTEVNGCMKVELTLAPGPAPQEIRRLWLNVPLRDAEAPLMHTIGDGLRQNYSGATPAGEGAVWDGSKVARAERWRNAFVPYVWLGSAERGLAAFAENDRGWFTAKGKSQAPTHELIRQGGRLTLRLYLVNRPVTLTAPSALALGLQASPTKPLPAGWRRTLPDAPGGLAVIPWGGIQCASQGPYADDWSIVEKILDARRGLPFDRAWLTRYVEQFHPPKAFNEADWAYYVEHFAGRAHDVGTSRPLAVYQEEMRAARSRPEWIVYQDEWKADDGPAARTSPDGLDLRGGQRSHSDISTITFPRSYADFGVWMAREWLRRGVSLYWDNTFLYPSYNTRSTAAYRCEDGHIQPALIIWAVRAYHHRVWNVLQECRRQRSEPLEWTLHMTNTEVLPVHTWGTVQLDHELAVSRPFSPEWLQTETVGRQVGNLPLSLYPVCGRDNERVKALPKEQQERLEWGMRAVHELQRSGPLEKLLTDFGYGTDAVLVHNYWADAPLLRVSPAAVKWLALVKPASREALVVLASWSAEPVTAEVALAPGVLPVPPETRWRAADAETGAALTARPGQPLAVPLAGPYGCRVIRLAW